MQGRLPDPVSALTRNIRTTSGTKWFERQVIERAR